MANAVEQVANSLNGNFKQVYGSKIMDLVPESDILLRDDRVKFVTKKGREGIQYNQPVIVSLPSGATWGLGGPTLNAVIAMQMANATVAGSAITMQDAIAYDAAARAAASEAAFEATVGLVIKTLFKAHSKLCELDLLYGNGGVTSGVSLCQSTAVVTSGSNAAVTVTYGTWAPAMFSGFQNAKLDAYQAGVQVNTNAALQVVSVNVVPASSTVGGLLTLSGNATDITALVATNGGTAVDYYWYGAYGNNMVGLEGILKNTGSLFGINASTYDLWGANTFDCGSTQLTFAKVQQGAALAVSRGLDEAVTLLAAPVTFADLVNEQAGARRYDSSYSSKKNENGSEALTFWGPSGKLEIVPHIFLKQGEAFMFPASELIKVGPLDKIAPALPGMGQDLFFQSPTAAQYLIRTFSDMALLLNTPAKATLLKSITNSQSA